MTNEKDNTTDLVIDDGCPEWAVELIQKIYVLAIESGDVKNPESNEWATTSHEKLLKLAGHMDESAGMDIEQETSALFERVARGLSSEDFTPDEIAFMINSRIPTGSKLKYCSASEVLAAL